MNHYLEKKSLTSCSPYSSGLQFFYVSILCSLFPKPTNRLCDKCGLPLVPSDKRNPFVTTTYGVGELICDANL
ncbi:glycerate kinase [Metabacillus dongyingensis]|uniref:glycerate kinase n=1 Tax=Metabacillus dongyingensis TaxID=2874282 RepID=UPI003B8D5582